MKKLLLSLAVIAVLAGTAIAAPLVVERARVDIPMGVKIAAIPIVAVFPPLSAFYFR